MKSKAVLFLFLLLCLPMWALANNDFVELPDFPLHPPGFFPQIVGITKATALDFQEVADANIGLPPSNQLRLYGSSNTGKLKCIDSLGADCSFSGGGGGTPGGANTNVQYNDSGAFGGNAAFTFNKANASLTVASTTGTELIETGVGQANGIAVFPDVAGIDIIAGIAGAQVEIASTGAPITLDASGSNILLGISGGANPVNFVGQTSGATTVQAPAVAGEELDIGLVGGGNAVLGLLGTTSGKVSQTTQSVAGTPTITWGTSTGTPVVTVSAPLSITAATGNATCTTCATASGLTNNRLPKINTSPALADSLLSDDGTTLNYTGTGGIKSSPTGGIGGTLTVPEGTAATASAGNDVVYGDSTSHTLKASYNNDSFLNIPRFSGAFTTGHCLQVSGTTNLIVDSGTTNCGGGGSPAFSAITSGTNTAATMTVGAGATLNGATTGIFDMSPLTTANNFKIPVIAGGAPTANGALTYDSTANEYKASVSAATNIIPSITGTTNPTTGFLPKWGAAATETNSLCDEAITTANTLTCTNTAGAKFVNVQTGTSPPTCTVGTAGTLCSSEGTAPTAASAVSELYSDSTAHEWKSNTNGGGAMLVTQVRPSPIHLTAQTASISLATLCAASAGACNQAGDYTVEWAFTQSGTACGTPGTGGVNFSLAWTDSNAVAHSATQMLMDDSTSGGTPLRGVKFTASTSNATAWASGQFNISSSGAAAIQYSTTYTACSVGTLTYVIDAWATRKE